MANSDSDPTPGLHESLRVVFNQICLKMNLALSACVFVLYCSLAMVMPLYALVHTW